MSINTVILTIKHLNKTRSVGSDGISLRFLQDALYVIAAYLTCIINTSLVTGIYPTQWKHAVIMPLFKSGNTNIVNNYRPISLLPIVSKIIEKIVAHQLACYLETKKLLSNSQHGFRPRLSTETALTVITNKIYNNMDHKKISLLTLCDLSKAFDSVNHKILLNKCKKLNISKFWLDNYLTNRTMSVRLNGAISKDQKVNYGVPQGSILGPLLFGIYVNDLSEHVNGFIVQYADDTQILHEGTVNNIHQLINDAETTLRQCKRYFLSNGLLLNPSKTQCIFLGNRQLLAKIPPDTTIHFDGENILPSYHVKNLGVYFDKYMLFDVHLNELQKKVTGILMYINRISKCFDKPTRILVTQSLALSTIYYCIQVWGSTNETLLCKAQKLQNFAAKVAVGGGRKYDRASPFLKELKWLRVKEKHMFDICVTMYKTLRRCYPDGFLSFLSFNTVNDVTNSKTRQRNNLHVPRTRTDSGARDLTVLGPKLWNQLPSTITLSQNLNSFKTNLRKHFQSANIV